MISAYMQVSSMISFTHAGHGVQMECSRERAIALLEHQLQGLDENMHATEEELKACILFISGNSIHLWSKESSAPLDCFPCI